MSGLIRLVDLNNNFFVTNPAENSVPSSFAAISYFQSPQLNIGTETIISTITAIVIRLSTK
jgi:hypothetical protein